MHADCCNAYAVHCVVLLYTGTRKILDWKSISGDEVIYAVDAFTTPQVITSLQQRLEHRALRVQILQRIAYFWVAEEKSPRKTKRTSYAMENVCIMTSRKDPS